MNRDSRQCTCLDRRKNRDPYHPIYSDAIAFMDETRYFGHDALDVTLKLIGDARTAFIADYCGTNRRKSDGFSVKRIDEQADRLIERAKGKVMATALKMAEKRTKPTRMAETKKTSQDTLMRLKAKLNG